MAKAQVAQSKVDQLSVQKKRVYNLLTDDWADAKLTCRALAVSENVHMSTNEVIGTWHSLAKMGLADVRTTGRHATARRVPVKKAEPRKPRQNTEVKNVKTETNVVHMKKDQEFDISEEIQSLNKDIQEAGKLASSAMEAVDKINARMLYIMPALAEKCEQSGIQDEEHLRLLEVEEKYNKLKELLR